MSPKLRSRRSKWSIVLSSMMRIGLKDIGDLGQRYSEESTLLLEPITFYFFKKLPPSSFSSFSFNSAFPLLDHLYQHELVSPNLTQTLPPATSQSLCSTLTDLLLEKSVDACFIHHLQSSSLRNPLQVEFCNITTPAFY